MRTKGFISPAESLAQHRWHLDREFKAQPLTYLNYVINYGGALASNEVEAFTGLQVAF